MQKLFTFQRLLQYFLLSFLVFVLVFFALSSNKKSLVKESIEKEDIAEDITTQTNTPESEIKEEIKDGVYTNYTYGFIFKYPVEKFPYIQEDNILHSNPPIIKNGQSEFNREGLRLSVSSLLVGKSGFENTLYNQIENKSINEVVKYTFWEAEKLFEDTVDGILVYGIFSRTIPGAETEGAYSYELLWRQDSYTHSISIFNLGVSDKDQKLVEVLISIFSSLKLTTSV